METTYIPYSKRNGITDPDLGGLLDYTERVIGWDISLHKQGGNFEIESEPFSIQKIFNKVYIFRFDGKEEIIIMNMDIRIFFRSYKTLLPCIRDLYSK